MPKRRHESQTDRDLASPHLGRKEIDALGDGYATEPDSDGVPVALGPEDAITPPPFDLTNHPMTQWMVKHVDRRYRASVDKISHAVHDMGGSPEMVARVTTLEKDAAESKTMFRIGKVLMGIVMAIAAGSGMAIFKATYGSGEKSGALTETLRYMQRDIDRLEQLVDTLQKFHQQRGGIFPPLPSPATGDTP